MSGQDKKYQESKNTYEKLVKARNKAISLIEDASARYVKEKTRARSKKIAAEKDGLVNSEKYSVLSIYESKSDIQEAYGIGIISEAEMAKLEALWDERESIKNSVDNTGHYSDDVTKALQAAILSITDLWDDEIEDAKVSVKSYEDMQAAEKERQERYEKVIEQQYNAYMRG